MKQAILKVKKASREMGRDRSCGVQAQAFPPSSDLSEERLMEKSPWLAEIQNALSPYWSARLAR